MDRNKTVVDSHGVIREAHKILPDDEQRVAFIAAIAELEDEECHRTRTFPVTRLHKVVGIKQSIYRADINKTSGWRLHVQYLDGALHLRDIVPGAKHDDVIRVITSKKDRYV